jgi:hypothetical protein
MCTPPTPVDLHLDRVGRRIDSDDDLVNHGPKNPLFQFHLCRGIVPRRTQIGAEREQARLLLLVQWHR